MAKDERFKTVSFGGYEKNAVDDYIHEMEKSHQEDIAGLKQTISKLSETVKSLQMVKDNISSESNQAIENMQKYNESLQNELEKANRKLAQKEEEYKSYSDKLEIISKTLVETNERCDVMLKEAEEKSREMLEDAEQQSANIIRRAQEERENLRVRAEEEYRQEVAKRNEECQKMLEDAEVEKETMLSGTREMVAVLRNSMKKECECVSAYMEDLMESVEDISRACQKAKVITDKAFKGIEETQQEQVPALPDKDAEEIPQIKFR